MRRRELLTAFGAASVLGLAPKNLPAQNTSRPATGWSSGVKGTWPFVLPEVLNDWTAVHVDGFRAPLSACVYDGEELSGGAPLGGLGTGYFTLEGSGKLGFSSIFNDMAPPTKIFSDWLLVESGTRHAPLSTARVWYLGHFPVVDLQAAFDELPLEIGIRSFFPYIVGDAAVSNTPVALFELELRNTSSQLLPLKLILKFPAAPAGAELVVRGDGVSLNAAGKGNYSLDVTVPGQNQKHVTFAVGWFAPEWRDSSSEPRYNRYSQRFRSAEEVADFGHANHGVLLQRVIAWQEEVYRSAYPGWLQDALIQGLYNHAVNSVWIARTRHDDWWGKDGWFVLNHTHRAGPLVEPLICRHQGHFPLLFFPELEGSTMDAFRHYQISDGEIPFCFGMRTSMRDPQFECQHPLNSGQYAQMVHRLFLRAGNKDQLMHFYDSAKRGIRYQYSLDNDNSGLVNEQPHDPSGEAWSANQMYDSWPWQGVSSYVAGNWLATLQAGKALAEIAGDREFSVECTQRLAKAQQAFEQRLWNGSYYDLWNNKDAGTSNATCLANQLLGEWCSRVAGLGGVLPAGHVAKALETVERLNMAATSYGLINGVSSDGRPYDTKFRPALDFGINIFFCENLCAAMTFMYHGKKDVGLEIARRLYRTAAIKTRAPWNQSHILHGDSGMPIWGEDFYSNLIIWALPMALEGLSVKEFGGSGLAKNMLSAADAAKHRS